MISNIEFSITDFNASLEPFRPVTQESEQAEEANKQAYTAAMNELNIKLQKGEITAEECLAEEKKLNSAFNPTGRLRS